MSYRVLIFIAAAIVAAAHASASTADNVGSQVVVPLVIYENDITTAIFVRNHEITPLPLQVRYVGERLTANRGYQLCPNITVPASGVLELDLRDTSSCRLGPNSNLGMLVLVSLDKSVVGRFSASAVIDVDGPTTPGRHSLLVDGLPLGALDTTDNIHQVTGLRSQRWTSAGFMISTDCFVGSLFDGSRTGGMIGRFSLKDQAGQPLGRDQFFALKPFELLGLRDVFARAGVTSTTDEGVRAEITLTGKGDAFVGYCRTKAESADGDTHSVKLAQVAESRDETRKRRFTAVTTPGVQAPGDRFTIATGATRILHGLYVRRPDVAVCGVNGADFLNLTAVAPDGTRFGGTSSSTGEFATAAQGFAGDNDLWGLEVSWDANAKRNQDASYSIGCRSGNGTSLGDQLAR